MISLTLPLPPSVNHAYRPGSRRDARGARFKVQAAKDFEQAVVLAICAASGDRKRPPNERVGLHRELVGPLVLEAWFWFPDRRKRDADNRIKVLQDALAKALVFDDSQITDVVLHKRLDRENPRTEVILTAATAPAEAW